MHPFNNSNYLFSYLSNCLFIVVTIQRFNEGERERERDICSRHEINYSSVRFSKITCLLFFDTMDESHKRHLIFF